LDHVRYSLVTHNDNKIEKELFYKLDGRFDGDLIYYRPDASFVYPSPIWIKQLMSHYTESDNVKTRKYAAKRVMKRVQCMKHNYLGYVIWAHSLNRFIKNELPGSSADLDYTINKMIQLHECIKSVARIRHTKDKRENNNIISTAIKFKENIDELKEKLPATKTINS
jgi:hypothetical protein